MFIEGLFLEVLEIIVGMYVKIFIVCAIWEIIKELVRVLEFLKVKDFINIRKFIGVELWEFRLMFLNFYRDVFNILLKLNVKKFLY